MRQKGMFDSNDRRTEAMEKDVPDWEGMTETDTATRAYLSAERLEQSQADLDTASVALMDVFREALNDLKQLK